MDGLDRLIEMLEERFGKWFSDGLLVLVCLGAAALSLRLFFGDFLFPVGHWSWEMIRYLRGHPAELTAFDGFHLALRLAGGLIVGGVAGSFSWWLGHRLLKRIKAKANEITDDTRSFVEEKKREIFSSLDGARKELGSYLSLHKEFLQKAKEAGIDVPQGLLSIHEGEGIEPQLPLGTEEDKPR